MRLFCSPLRGSITCRFAVMALAVFAAVGALAGALLRDAVRSREERFATYHTVFVADRIVGPNLTEATDTPQLDELVRAEVVTPDVRAVRVFDAAGQLLYSLPGGQGVVVRPSAVGRSLRGDVFSLVNRRSFLDSFAPIRGRDGTIVGALELVQSYAPVRLEIRGTLTRLGGGLALALAVLYAALLPVLIRASRRAQRQARETEALTAAKLGAEAERNDALQSVVAP